ncbi:MAG: DUF2079 domain-containing protein [Bacteroidia bacterium]
MNRIILFIHVFFFLVFGLISVLNHYYFRSAGLDYGIANQALYQYAHFHSADITQLLPARTLPYLALHLSLWVPIISPFYYIFGSYTLLIFQNLALIFAGAGLVKLGKILQLKDGVLIWVLIQFYVSFAIYAALAFDYHDNVIGACFLPWLFYYFHKQNSFGTFLCFVGLLISKENLAIFAGFIAIGMFGMSFKQGKFWRIFTGSLFCLSIAWFYWAAYILMPGLNPEAKFEQLNRYSYLGNSLPQMVSYILKHPIYMFKLFYTSQVQPDPLEIVKQEFLWVLFLSGGIIFIVRPVFLWMALPILMQKLWNKELAFWGISYHYQIELATLIGVAILYYLNTVKKSLVQTVMAVLLCLSTGICTYLFMHQRKADFDPMRENVFKKARYEAPFDINLVQNKIAQLPAKSKICAQSNLMPHVANRQKIYHFPYIQDADLILVLQPQLIAYPLPAEKAISLLDSLRQSIYWKEDSSAYPLRVFTKVE